MYITTTKCEREWCTLERYISDQYIHFIHVLYAWENPGRNELKTKNPGTNFLARNFHHYMDVCISNNIGSINYLKCFSIVAIFFGIEILWFQVYWTQSIYYQVFYSMKIFPIHSLYHKNSIYLFYDSKKKMENKKYIKSYLQKYKKKIEDLCRFLHD